MNLKNLFLLFLLFGFLFAQSKSTYLLVNSKDWKDVISGGVYASEHGLNYIFILTPQQADYFSSLFSKGTNKIIYYESNNPVDNSLYSKFQGLENVELNKMDSLYYYFASNSPNNGAVVVGNEIGAEAVSAAPYAILRGWGLYFASKSNANDLVSQLLNQKKEILVYGSIANSVNLDVKKINTGSIYLDNVEILKLFSFYKEPIQIVFTSGKTFERSIVSSQPVALVGRTEVSKDLILFLSSKPSIKGLVYYGDADINGAILSLKKELGIPVFTNLGNAFSPDSQMKPPIVLNLPSRDVIIKVNPPVYDVQLKSIVFSVENKGNCNAYLRAVVELPNGKFVGSQQIELGALQTYTFVLPLSSDGINTNTFDLKLHIYSSCEKDIIESIDIIDFKGVKFTNQNNQQPSAVVQQEQKSKEYSSSNQLAPTNYSNSIVNWIFVLVIILIIIVIYFYNKDLLTVREISQKKPKETKTKKEEKHHKKR
jgi:hypothetical protein